VNFTKVPEEEKHNFLWLPDISNVLDIAHAGFKINNHSTQYAIYISSLVSTVGKKKEYANFCRTKIH